MIENLKKSIAEKKQEIKKLEFQEIYKWLKYLIVFLVVLIFFLITIKEPKLSDKIFKVFFVSISVYTIIIISYSVVLAFAYDEKYDLNKHPDIIKGKIKELQKEIQLLIKEKEFFSKIADDKSMFQTELGLIDNVLYLDCKSEDYRHAFSFASNHYDDPEKMMQYARFYEHDTFDIDCKKNVPVLILLREGNYVAIEEVIKIARKIETRFTFQKTIGKRTYYHHYPPIILLILHWQGYGLPSYVYRGWSSPNSNRLEDRLINLRILTMDSWQIFLK